MRHCGSTPQFLEKDNNVFGLVLPADYCAEHEGGIDDLMVEFGIPLRKDTEGPFGIERYLIREIPDEIVWQEGDKSSLLAVDRYHSELTLEQARVKFKSHAHPDIGGAWDERSFAVFVQTKKQVRKLSQIQKAIFDLNAVVFLGGGLHVFDRASLVIAIADRIPVEHKTEMREHHQQTAKLMLAVEEIGIQERLAASNCHYYALSPGWKRQENTQYPVIFFLNPVDQHKHNYGWFTVEDLEAWCEGRGNILK